MITLISAGRRQLISFVRAQAVLVAVVMRVDFTGSRGNVRRGVRNNARSVAAGKAQAAQAYSTLEFKNKS